MDAVRAAIRTAISTHALREEGDCRATTSCRPRWPTISTHALREEGDRSDD